MATIAVSAMQAKVALLRAGLLPQVEAWIDTQDEETKLIWETAGDFYRDSQLIARAAVALGLSSNQVDTLFNQAATIAA